MCVSVNVLSDVLVLYVSADLERVLCRCVPNLPSLGRFRALASVLYGDVALLGVLLDSELSLSCALRSLSLLSLPLVFAAFVATVFCPFAVALRVTILQGGSVVGALSSKEK